MKITKKIIILLFMIMGLLTLGMSKVEAKEDNEYPTLPGSASDIKYNQTYYIPASMYHGRDHLFCVQHGFFMHDPGTTYKLYKTISIVDSIATIYDKNSSSDWDTSNKNLFKKDYNKILATGIAKYDENNEITKLQSFLWGYMDTWVQEVGWLEGIDSEFARGSKVDKAGEQDATEVAKEVDEATGDILDLEDITDYDNLNIGTLNFNGTNYQKIGPYKIIGVPTDGINQFNISETSGNNQGIKIVRKIEEEWQEVTKQSETKIANNKSFYILIPMNSNAIKGSVTFNTSKKVAETVKATIYLLKSKKDSWQNLAIARGKITEKDAQASITVNFELPATAKITIQKKAWINGKETDIPIMGAGFVVFRYVEDTNGSWYKNSSGDYTQSTEGLTVKQKATKYKREYVNHAYESNGYYTFDKTVSYNMIMGTNLSVAQHDIRKERFHQAPSRTGWYNDFIFFTDEKGEISLDYLQPGTWYAQECATPEEYVYALTHWKSASYEYVSGYGDVYYWYNGGTQKLIDAINLQGVCYPNVLNTGNITVSRWANIPLRNGKS